MSPNTYEWWRDICNFCNELALVITRLFTGVLAFGGLFFWWLPTSGRFILRAYQRAPAQACLPTGCLGDFITRGETSKKSTATSGAVTGVVGCRSGDSVGEISDRFRLVPPRYTIPSPSHPGTPSRNHHRTKARDRRWGEHLLITASSSIDTYFMTMDLPRKRPPKRKDDRIILHFVSCEGLVHGLDLVTHTVHQAACKPWRVRLLIPAPGL